MTRWMGVAACCVLLLIPAGAWAASDWTHEATYGEQALGKLTFGLTNAALGWTSLFTTPYDAVQSGDRVVLAVGRGLWSTVGQTVGGALHLATFPLTTVDVPLPEGGVDLLR